MSNAERILLRLDELLNAPVELTLYGRAALALGFPETHSDFAISLDVDAILWMGQAEELDRVSNFWEALDQLNVEFEDSGLYMTHLFEESQVVLTPSWKSLRIPLHISTKHLSLYRLSDIDLMLSKLMRYDPIDLAIFILLLQNRN